LKKNEADIKAHIAAATRKPDQVDRAHAGN